MALSDPLYIVALTVHAESSSHFTTGEVNYKFEIIDHVPQRSFIICCHNYANEKHVREGCSGGWKSAWGTCLELRARAASASSSPF